MTRSRLRQTVAVLTVAAIAVPAGVAQGSSGKSRAPTPPTTLAGFTSQRWPSFFRLTENQRRLVIGSIALDMSCTSGTRFTLEDEYREVPIGAGGKLSDNWAAPPTKLSDGYTVAGTGSIVATLDRKRRRLTGVWRVQQTFISPAGQTDQCDSGRVRFTATA